MITLLLFKIGFFLGGTSSIFLGLFIYLQGRKNALNRTYFGLSVCSAIWSLGFLGLLSVDNYAYAYALRTIMDIGAIILPAFWIHFVYTVLKLKVSLPEIASYYLFGMLVLCLNLVDYFYKGLFVQGLSEKGIFDYYPTAAAGYYLFIAFYFIVVPRSVYLLARGYWNNTGLEAQRISFILLGALLGFCGGSTAFLYTFGVGVPPYGILLFAFYPMTVGYAVTRLGLFNIKVVAAGVLIAALTIFTLIRMLLSGTAQDQILNGGLFIAVCIFGILLLKSVNKEVEQRELIEKQEKELEVVNRQQEGLLHFISHEVKGYLTKSEAGFAAIVEGDFGAVPEHLTGMAKSALADTRKGVQTVMEILSAANLQKGTVEFKKEPFDFQKLVAEALEDFKRTAEDKKLSLTSDLRDADYTILGDRHKISRHVIRNLVDNALRYTLSGSIHVELSRTGNTVRFSVRDTGVGITQEDMQKLFTEGGKGKDSLRVNVDSTGYGLFVAKSVVVAHNGKIWAESEGQGKGATFIVELPVTHA